MIRRLLLILFLYILLVWLLAARSYYPDSMQLVNHGILWTAIGVGVLLGFLIVERLVMWWRQRTAPKPPSTETPVPVPEAGHEDDATLMALLREADDRLARVPGTSTGNSRVSVRDLPLFLVVGPEGAGKTSILVNSGSEPSLLAGQVLGSGAAITSTRVANIWLANQQAFLEVSGSVFSSEPGRLMEFISVLRPGGNSRGWKRSLRLFQKPISLRGVVLCIDSRDFAGTPEPSSLDRAAQKIRERLQAIANVLGAAFPVYVILTKLDGLPYFAEYFARLSEDECGQVFGVLIKEKPAGENESRVWAEAETKRLNRAFQSLVGRLSDRRLLALTVEPDPSNKPAVYEFPREFKRIRTPLVQFLVDVFKPDPLKATPRLRGFFFTGTKKVERLPGSSEAKSVYSSQRAFDATQIFKPGMRVSPGEPSIAFGGAPGSSGTGALVNRWAFLTELFHRVLTDDRPAIQRLHGRTLFGRYQQYGLGGAVGLAALLILIWTISWIGNWSLSSRVATTISEMQRAPANLDLASLQALDELRAQLEELDKGGSLWLHWGLYQGDALGDVAQRVYFERLRQLSLEHLNQTLATHLQHASSELQSTATTYDRLKTHRTITALGCPVDRPLVSRVLKATAAEAYAGLGGDEMNLLQTQLDFYAKELQQHNRPPVRLAESSVAVEEARGYLRKAGGLDQQLRSIVNQLNQQVQAVSVTQNPEDYRSVLKGNESVAGAFTKNGYQLFDGLTAKVGKSDGETCVTGNIDRVESVMNVADSRTRDQLKALYLRHYADAWKQFLASYSVIPYKDTNDAATHLHKLSTSRSPLLGIVQLVAVNTDFPPPKPGEPSFWEKGAQAIGFNRAVSAVGRTEKAVAEVRQSGDNNSRLMTPADVARLFQPVLFTTPPEVDVLVNDHDQQYVDGLRKLQSSLDSLVQASASEKPMAIAQARAALGQAQSAQGALADKFNNVGNEGLSQQLADLLEQPINLADRPNIIPNADKLVVYSKDRDLAAFCRDMGPILNKYPFSAASLIGASTTDLSNGFAPMTGKVWKYALEKGADLVVHNGIKWDRNPSWQGPRVTQDLVNFLNQAQLFTNALFTDSGMLQPKLKYTLRPSGSVNVRLVLDGTDLRSSRSSLQRNFSWPAPDIEKQGAEGSVDSAGGAGFGKYDGLWGVFHLFQNADERPSGQTLVQWSENRGRGGAVLQKIDPPARVEFVEFPGGVDLFNPKFFDALKCPSKAVTVN